MSNYNVYKEYLFSLAKSENIIADIDDWFLKIAMNSVCLNELDEEGKALLHYAVDNELSDLVVLFLEHGADVNGLTRDRNTPLHVASLNGHFSIMRVLLKAGALVNAKDDRGRTPFHLAAINGDQTMMKYLLEQGADITIADDSGYTALHDVVNQGSFYSVEFLIAQGASIDAQNNEERFTPLHCAILNKDVRIIDQLIEKGANVYARDKDGATALHLLIDGIEDKEVDIVIQITERLVKASSLSIFDQRDRNGNKPLDQIMDNDTHKRFMLGLQRKILGQIRNFASFNTRFFSAPSLKDEEEGIVPPTKRLKT